MKAFRQLGRLSVELNFDEHITAEDLNLHSAPRHKSCWSKFSNTRLGRAQRKRDAEEADTPASSEDAVRKRIQNHQTQPDNICIFCAKADGHLHDFMTLHADDNIRCMATDLQDTALLARIAGGDLKAIEAEYHFPCLSELRYHHCSLSRQQRRQSCEAETQRQKNKARAFTELMTHIENSVEGGTFC